MKPSRAAQNPPGRTLKGRTASGQKKPRSIACHRCHARKVKCSGGTPCVNCRDADAMTQCVYPSRDRQVKMSEQYLDEVLRENERLREEQNDAGGNAEHVAAVNVQDSTETREAVQNPLLEDRPWFFNVASLDLPIHISEAADAAFATRFRETLGTVHMNHIPRMSYITDERLMILSESGCSWPSPARARFLVNVALNTVCCNYHVLRKSVALGHLEHAIQSQGNGERLTICKLLALFALGEAYSSKTAAHETSFPGLVYFARARRMISVPAERPRMDTMEIVLLLTIYSYTLNRRHSAYSFASSAIRLGVIMGMHMNIPDHQFQDRKAREHRTRLWWTAYILDRTCASRLGHPVSIQDEDIIVDMPSSVGLDNESDFGDVEYMLRSIELAKLTQQTIQSIYNRRKQRYPFSQRVQSSLKDLTKWVETLPPHLQLGEHGEAKGLLSNIIHLHLTFNQCVIMTTRPILLHVLRTHKRAWVDKSIDPKSCLPDSAHTLAETCLQCSRHSYRLLSEAWIHGSFSIFDYFNTQFLFSAAISLAISSLLKSNQSRHDGDDFLNAAELIEQLGQNGNFGAKEYCLHLNAMKESMDKIEGDAQFGPSPTTFTNTTARPSMPYQGSSTMTAGMALAEPSLQEFLSDPDLNLQFFDTPAFDGVQTPFWPEMWGDGWATG